MALGYPSEVSRLEGSDLFGRGGEMGRRMSAHDWGATPLGPPAGWPLSLRSALSICLGSGFPIAIYWGPQLALLYNDAWSAIVGAKHPWALGRSAKDVWPEIWETIGPLFTHVLTTGEATYREDQLQSMRRHGYTEECYVNYTFSPIRGDEGGVDGIFNAVIETNAEAFAAERRRAESLAELDRANARVSEVNKRLAEQLTEFETLLDVLPVGIAIARDPECREIRVNPAFARVLGIDARANASKTAPPGERPENFRCLDDDGREVLPTELPMQVAAARGTPVLGAEFNIVHDDGRVYRLLEYAAPLFDEHDRPRGSVGAFVDVTERARVEKHREELLERERAAREEMDRLRQAAESASRAKDEFLAMLGHELRNPLAPIMTALQLMRLRGDGRLERERDVIERQVSHLTRLVDDLLDVSRIARGKVELKKEPIEVAEVVAKAIEQASPLLEARNHVLELDVPRAGLLVDADQIRLGQVISNLLTNAAKYTEAGGRISVSARHEPGHVIITVRDTGIGISPDMLPRVFDLFAQETQAADRAQGGLGLGLTIVRNMVDLHGGSVSVSSDGLGKGSRFDVRLPALDVAQRSAFDGEKPVPGAEPSSDALRVLVVDDNQDAAEMLVEVLRSFGHDARAAYDGPAALRLCREFVPDVALLDIGLPVMDGYELAERMRELPGLASLRLVAVTGYGQDSDRERSRASGFHHHLVKPIDIDRIDEVIRRRLEV